jgi:hypothetical protein
LTILVFSQSRLRSSTNIYLRALAGFDLLYLASVAALSFYHSFPHHHPYFLYYRPYGPFITDFASNTSVWLTAAFTIERFFVVTNPMKNLKYCSAHMAQRIVIIVALVCFLCALSTAFEFKVVHVYNNQTNTTKLEVQSTALGNNDLYLQIIAIFSLIVFVLIPFITIATLNVFLIRSLRQARHIRHSLSQAMIASEARTTLILVVVVLTFLICQGPTATIMIVSVFVTLDNNLFRGINNIFNLLVAINACANFFLYVGLSEKFRKTFVELLFTRVNGKLLPASFRDQRRRGTDAGLIGNHNGHGLRGHNRTYEYGFTGLKTDPM